MLCRNKTYIKLYQKCCAYNKTERRNPLA